MTTLLQRSDPAPRPDLGVTRTGLPPRLAAVLAYLAWFVTGLLFVLLEPDNRFVRFHAWQSVVGFGGLLAGVVLLALAGVLLFMLTGTGLTAARVLVQLVLVGGAVAWGVCLFKAYSGEQWKLPLVGSVAERLSARRPR